MDKNVRKLMNERFIHVYNLLVERGEIKSHDRSKSISKFAEIILGKPHAFIIKKYLDESESRTITFEQVTRLCQEYKVNTAYMFEGLGNPFSTQQISAKKSNETTVNHDGNILLTNIEAFASSTVSINVYENTERFFIPGIRGEHVAFNINGNSMAPTIQDGDMVICRALENHSHLRENNIYAVVANDSVMIKRLQRVYDKNGHWSGVKLISDNYIEHDPFMLELNEVRQILEVIRRVTDLSTS